MTVQRMLLRYGSRPRFKNNLTTNRRRNSILKDRRFDCDLSEDSFWNRAQFIREYNVI